VLMVRLSFDLFVIYLLPKKAQNISENTAAWQEQNSREVCS